MKFITISQVGYNAPSQANWCYRVWKVDFINTNKDYCLSETVSEKFGGDSRFIATVNTLNLKIIKTQEVYTGTGTQKMTGVASLLDIESPELLEKVKEFIRK